MRTIAARKQLALPIQGFHQTARPNSGPLGWHAGIFDRAYFRAAGRIKVPFAFGAFLGVDDIHIVLETNCRIWAFELTGSAHGALRRDNLVSHGALLRPLDCLAQLSIRVPSMCGKRSG